MKPNVMLYCLTADTAYFIQYDEGDNLFDTRKYPIIFLSQTMIAKRFIRLPRDDFLNFTQYINVDQVNVVWMFHSVRCGSTAYSQVFNALPGWITMSEPQSLGSIFDTQGDQALFFVKSAEFKTVAEAIVKCNLKNIPENNKGVFIKSSVFDEHLPPMIGKVFPHHKLLFAYRDVQPGAESFYKVVNPVVVDAMLSLSIDPFTEDRHGARQRLMASLGYLTDNVKNLLQKVRPQSLIEWYTLQWSIRNHLFHQAIRGNKAIRFYSLRYEDLQRNRTDTIVRLFKHLNIDQENLDAALASLEIDSQEGTFLSKQARARNPNWNRTEDSVARCNEILRAFKLPDFDSDFNFDAWIKMMNEL